MGCQLFRAKTNSEEATKFWLKLQELEKKRLEELEKKRLEDQEKQIIFNDDKTITQENDPQQTIQKQKKKLEIHNLQSISTISNPRRKQKQLDIQFQIVNEKLIIVKKPLVQGIVQEQDRQKQQSEFQIQQKGIVSQDNNKIIQNNIQQDVQNNIIQNIQPQNNNQQQEIQPQNIQDEIAQQIEDGITVHPHEESILKRCFMIDKQQLKIGKLSAQFLSEIYTITSEIILDQIIYRIITTNQLMYSQRVTWLIKVLINLSNCEIESSIAKFYDGTISEATLIKLRNTIIDKIISAVARPQILEWQIDREDINKYTSEENQIASQVYDMLFGQEIKSNLEVSFENLDHPALNNLLTYLDTKSQPQDCLRFLELITKRELYKCQKVNISECVKQQKALVLLDKLTFYPRITGLLLENSWAFGKFQQFTTGRDIQQYSIFGSILCLSTFPRDFPQVISIFSNPEKNLSIMKECYRGPIYEIIYKTADIFLKIVRRGKQAQLSLFTYLCKLIEINLNIEKVTQRELFQKCCFQGMMFNLSQVLLEIFNPFIYNIEQANSKISKINLDLLAYTKHHPLLSKIYSNVKQMAPLKTEFIPLDKSPDLDAMTVLYLLIQRVLGLQQHMYIDYVVSYVFLQYDKKNFGANSKFTKESEIDKATYDALLLHPKSIQNTIQFLSFQCKVALSLLDENYKPKYPYGLLSNQFMNDIPNYCFIYNSNGVALDYLDEVISICEFTIITMKHHELNEDIHIRCKGMDLFYIFNEYFTQQDYKNSQKSLKIFSSNKIIQDYLIDGLIQSYVDHDRVKMSNILPPFRFKQAICQLLTYILTTHNQIYQKKLLEFINKNKTIYQNFAFVFINDIKEMIDNCMQQTKKIKQDEIQESNQSTMEQALLPVQEKLLRQLLKQIGEKKCLYEWKGVKDVFKNLIMFTKIEPKAFLIEETRQQFAQNLNYVLEQLNGSDNEIFNSKFLENQDVKPKEISNDIIEIFINLQDQSVFWEEIAMNNESSQIQILNQLVNKLSYQSTLPEHQLQKFFQIIQNLDLLKHDFDQILNDLSKDSNLERRYLDQLTRSLMTDPVMLPNSKQIVDRVTIKRYLLKKQEDPFDRSFLIPEMLIEQKELKLEIRYYLEQKKQKLREQRKSFQNSYK